MKDLKKPIVIFFVFGGCSLGVAAGKATIGGPTAGGWAILGAAALLVSGILYLYARYR